MYEANLDGRDLNSSGDKLRGFSTKSAAKKHQFEYFVTLFFFRYLYGALVSK